MKRILSLLVLTVLLTLPTVTAQNNSARKNGNAPANPPLSLTLPNKEGDVRFLVVGDTGTGSHQQEQLAQIMLRYRQMFPPATSRCRMQDQHETRPWSMSSDASL